MNGEGLKYINPLYMSYVKDHLGNYDGHHGYGYKSFEAFVNTVHQINNGQLTTTNPQHLPTLQRTMYVTGILEAGRLSLDNNNTKVDILYSDKDKPLVMTGLKC